MNSLFWTQGKTKMLNAGLQFWKGKQPIGKEHRSVNNFSNVKGKTNSDSRYQLSTAFSDWSRIRLQTRTIFSKTTYYLDIRSKDESVRIHDGIYTMGNALFKDEYEPNILQFDYFMKREDLKNKDVLQFEVDLSSDEKTFRSTATTRSYRMISVAMPLTKTKVYVEMPGDFTKERVVIPIELELFEKTDVYFRKVTQLCDREEDFVTKRNAVIFKHMTDNLGFNNLLDQKNVPKIAVIVPGGGIRSVVGMCGAMTALKDNGILDSTMYTAGSSGSAWYLLALSSNDKQNSPTELTNGIRQKLKNASHIRFMILYYVCHWLKQILRGKNSNQMNNSFSTTFGWIIGNLLNEKNVYYLSDQADKLKDGCVPLPLIAALRVRDASMVSEHNEWIDFSPYEVFIPKYGAAIDIKKFGEQMFGGFSVKKSNEQTIAFLQGMCGSGFSIQRNLKPPEGKWYMSMGGIKYQIASLFDTEDSIYIAKVPNILRGFAELNRLGDNLEKKDLETYIADFHSTNMMLVDPGISACNSPYPTVLHPSRKVDVILSFDFSNRYADHEWPFQELELAEKWANERDWPFPKLFPKLDSIRKEWNKGQYEEVYVFQGENSPTIVHFVMINKSFRQTGVAKTDFDILPEYSTLKCHFSEQEFDKFNLLVQHNVRKNENTIMSCIREVIDRKQRETQNSEQKNDCK